MRQIKYILTLLLLLFSFALSGELYQSHLQNFTNDFYYIDIDKKDIDEVYSVLITVTEKYNVEVFTIDRNDITAYSTELTIYTTSTSRGILKNKCDITEGEFKSLVSGTTNVRICSLEEIKNNPNVHIYYFDGKKDDVISARTYINSVIATSYVHKESITGNENLVYVIWLVVYVFILLLTWLTIQFGRKADFLKISLGVSPYSIIFKNICFDTVFNILSFALSYYYLSSEISIFYKIKFVVTGMIIMLAVNALLYFTLLAADYKEVFYGANIGEKLLANIYVIKAIVVITLVLSMVCNYTMIKKSVESLKPYKVIESLKGYNTLDLIPLDYSPEGFATLESEIFFESYLNDTLLLSISSAALEEEPLVVINDLAVNTVVSNSQYFQDKSDMFIVYVPEERIDELGEEEIIFAVETTASTYFGLGLDEISYSIATYPHSDVIYFNLMEESPLEYGFTSVSDPIMVYCNLSDDDINELVSEGTVVDFESLWSSLIFKINDATSFSDSIKTGLSSVYFADLIKQCNQYKVSIMRILWINSVLSVFLLILCTLLIVTAIRLEYMIDSKEMILKKLVGYSVISANKEVILLNLFIIFIAFVTGFIISKMYRIFPVNQLFFITFIIFVYDGVLFLLSTFFVETKNIVNVLKGGN